MAHARPDYFLFRAGIRARRDDLNAILDGLEEWLYSEEADDVDLPALKAKRAKVGLMIVTH